MKSEDYKRGVRDMAARLAAELNSYTIIRIELTEQRLLADPVPKFAVGMVVMYEVRDRKYPIQIASIRKENIVGNGEWLYLAEGMNLTECYESGLRALTPLEATGKE